MSIVFLGWRLLCFPILLWSIALFLSYQSQVCSGLAIECVKMKSNGSWYEAFSVQTTEQQDEKIVQVEDSLAVRKIQSISSRIQRESLI
jgi:hypothetical protein